MNYLSMKKEVADMAARYNWFEGEEEYPDYVSFMVDILEKAGYTVTRTLIECVWRYHSDDYAAGWLGVGKGSEEEILRVFKLYCDVVEVNQ